MEASTAPSASGLTDEQQDFVAAMRDFVERETFEMPEDDHHSDEVAAKMAELGWYGLQIAEEYGGSDGSFLDACLFLEETARGQMPVGAYGVTLICVGALNRFGTEEQKQRPARPGDQGRHAGDRDVRARLGLRRGVAEVQGAAARTANGCCPARRCGAPTPTGPATR